MTPEEAIKTIEIATAKVEWEYPMDYAMAFEMAKEALKKQIPRRPIKANRIVKEDGLYFLADENEYWKCPMCVLYDVPLRENQKYCHYCGQALD